MFNNPEKEAWAAEEEYAKRKEAAYIQISHLKNQFANWSKAPATETEKQNLEGYQALSLGIGLSIAEQLEGIRKAIELLEFNS